MKIKDFLNSFLVAVSITFVSIFNCSYASQNSNSSTSETAIVFSKKLSLSNSRTWTLEEMRHAKPGPSESSAPDDSTPRAKSKASAPASKDPIQSPLILSQPAESAGKNKGVSAHSEREVGVIFYKKGGENYFCSASTINSLRKNTVLSVAHCLISRSGAEHEFATDVTYVPAYDTRNANPMPYGQWPASAYFISKHYKETGHYEEDQAIITLYPRNNLEVVDVVGGYGLGINYSQVQNNVRILGYATTIAGEPVDTGIPRECRGSTVQEYTFAVMNGCLIGPGSSGSPFLLNKVAFAANHVGVYGPGYVIRANAATPNGNSVAELFDEATNSYVFRVGTKIDVGLFSAAGFIGVEGTLPPVTTIVHSPASNMLHLRGGVIEAGQWQFSILFLDQSGRISRQSISVTVL